VILVFTRATPHHHPGGMETLAWSLAVEWAGAGRDVRVVTTAIPGARERFSADGVCVVPLLDTPPGRYSPAWWSASRRYWTELTEAPDVVLSVSAGAYAAARERTRHPRTAFVLQAHGTSAMEIGSKLRARTLRSLAGVPKNAIALPRDLARYRDFDRIVAVGPRVRESLAAVPQRWAAPPDRIRLIPNGVRADAHAFDPIAREKTRRALGVDDRAIVIACVGRLHIQKRFDRTLRALAVLRDRDSFRLLVVGDGPDGARLRALAGRLGVSDLVHFTGPVDEAGVRDHHSAADVSVLTTARREVGLPMSVLEALASGLPCLVPRGLGAGPVYEIDTADPDRLADVLYRRTRERGPRTSRLPADLHLDHCAREYLRLFDEIGTP
jgi:glycosyltransferase involved in cell wall biosynthesis